MPLYEYQCDICGSEVEKIKNPSDDAPVCCGQPMGKRMSAIAMVKWKGEGGFPARRKDISDRKALMSRKQIPYFMPGNKE